MSEKKSKLNDVEFDKKENDASKQPIVLNSMLINKTVVSDKFEQICDIFYWLERRRYNQIFMYCISPNQQIHKIF